MCLFLLSIFTFDYNLHFLLPLYACIFFGVDSGYCYVIIFSVGILMFNLKCTDFMLPDSEATCSSDLSF